MMSVEYIRFLWRTVVISRHSNHRENRYGRMKTMHRIIFGDNLEVLQSMPSRSIRLIYIDPPFNTGKVQTRKQLKTDRDEKGDRVGFKGYTYRTTFLGEKRYLDKFNNFLAFFERECGDASAGLTAAGSFFFHIAHREVHYCKILPLPVV